MFADRSLKLMAPQIRAWNSQLLKSKKIVNLSLWLTGHSVSTCFCGIPPLACVHSSLSALTASRASASRPLSSRLPRQHQRLASSQIFKRTMASLDPFSSKLPECHLLFSLVMTLRRAGVLYHHKSNLLLDLGRRRANSSVCCEVVACLLGYKWIKLSQLCLSYLKFSL